MSWKYSITIIDTSDEMKGAKFCTIAILCVSLFNLVASTTPTRAQVERLEEQIQQLTLKVQEKQEATKLVRSRRASSEVLNENRKSKNL